MPSVSGDQQRFFAAAYRRKAAGRPRSTDPKMGAGKMREFMHKVPGAPERKNSRYGSPPVSEET